MDTKKVTNGGSAIGEAIGHYMESVIQDYISKFIEDYPCHFLKEIGYNKITGKTSKKLLLYDNFGNDYNIDGVITNESMQPLVLLESKYIRYKKHNRDKGSWICNAHSAIRKRYPSIRASIAVLAGSWSKTSLAMIKSYDVNVFLIDFSLISKLLKDKGIDFEWTENEHSKALLAWEKYDKLSEKEKYGIAVEMVDSIKNNLFDLLKTVLDDTKPRNIKQIIVEIHTTKGEIKSMKFDSITEAITYLSDFSLDELFESASFISIFDIPNNEDENII
ncbi:MAG: hypothetical protein K2H47_11005 [Muribaculaceae bacterium]|nr:hypothetical protein [Muribaculaceae bacterium]